MDLLPLALTLLVMTTMASMTSMTTMTSMTSMTTMTLKTVMTAMTTMATLTSMTVMTAMTTMATLTSKTTMTSMTAMTSMTVMTMMTMMTSMTAVTAATTVPATVPTLLLVPLDMAPDSFDDRYRGCGRAMTAALPALNRSELLRGGHLAEAWALAEAERRVRPSPASPASPLSPAQLTALLAYTAPLPLHRTFNAAVRSSGRSGREYRANFHFKALHFLLSGALSALRDARGPRCHRVFRGVRGVRFEARPGRTVRFGHFASASLRNRSSWSFGMDTAFQVSTCQGVDISSFSFFPHEEEVLIPPFETFQVTEVTRVTRAGDSRGDSAGDTVRIALRSSGVFSKYNCEWLRGGSVTRPLPHLGGLLLATTALAVATGTF